MPELLEEALAAWRDCPDSLPDLGRPSSDAERALRETEMDRFLEAIQKELRHPPRTRAERRCVHERLTDAFVRFGRSALGLEDRHFEILLAGGFSGIATNLARQARSFDRSVSAADIFQASRNAWTACGLQVLYGKSMCLTPGIFAYSMLYPYTDNYLDDAGIPAEKKSGFGARFGKRLAGEPASPANQHEETIWRLVGVIETDQPRPDFPGVFESLSRIHGAQQESMRLLRDSALPADEVLRLCAAKGGASVLADAYLAAGTLTAEQARFAFYWGVFLQFADDLQDLMEDRDNGVLTIFSAAAGREPLDGVTSRTLQFGRVVMLLMHYLPETDCSALKELIQRSCLGMMIRCAGDVSEFYSNDFLARIEACSPFRFSFLNERRKRFAKRSGLLVKLFEAFLAGDEDEPAFPFLPGSLLPRF